MSSVLLYELYKENSASNSSLQNKIAGILPFTLFWLHTLRRLLECLFVSKFGSSARIHTVGYATGVL